MRLLRMGIEGNNPSLVAHTIIFSAAKALDQAKNGVQPNAKVKTNQRRPAAQPKR